MSSSSTAETVGNIEELLKQILVRVPALSLIRFKGVSKHWLSLISDPVFRRRHTLQNPHPKVSAFFDASLNSFPLETPPWWDPFETLNNLVPDGKELRILLSCNGLFLCCIQLSDEHATDDDDEEWKHLPLYVVNPTTNEFVHLPPPSVGPDAAFVGCALAFDPSKSPYFKLVCLTNNKVDQHDIDIYSSETGEWKHLITPYFPSPSSNLRYRPLHLDDRSMVAAVYCNGAVHWIRDKDESSLQFGSFEDGRWKFFRNESDVLHYFDISQERLRVVSATPPLSSVVKSIPLYSSIVGFEHPTLRPKLSQRYFGECGGRLYLIETYEHCNTQFDVMEMERDYSGWFVKYHVDLNPLVTALPGPDWNDFTVLCLSQKKESSQETTDEAQDSSVDLMLHMPGKVISYSLRNETFKTSIEFADKNIFLFSTDDHGNRVDVTFPFMLTLACL